MAEKAETNKQGLSRYIDAATRRQIRQKYGFGCCVCGNAIVDYEHVDPPFENATEHNPEAMTLLCPDCHAKVTRKFWSKDKIKKAMKNPFSLKEGFSHSSLDASSDDFYILFGNSPIRTPIPIRVNGIPLFEIKNPEAEGEPFRFSGSFYDNTGKKTLEIVDNEYRCSNLNWDVQAVGGRITINEGKWGVHLILRMLPPNAISVDKLNMFYKGYSLVAGNEGFFVKDPRNNIIRVGGIDASAVGFDLHI